VGGAIRPITAPDREWVRQVLTQHFASPRIVSRGVPYDSDDLPGLLAEEGGIPAGLLLYYMSSQECEVVVLVSLTEGKGVGTGLLAEVERTARETSCRRLWLVTTNDNLRAIEFYRKLGWREVAVHRGAMVEARRLKPEIPQLGSNGIPIEDEVEFELLL
jgi:GNAT superfamily N-acetyltransferase